MRRIYYTGTDMGDGSLGVAFFESRECVELMEEHDPATYRGEGGGSFMVSGEVAGIEVQTLRDVLDIIEEESADYA